MHQCQVGTLIEVLRKLIYHYFTV